MVTNVMPNSSEDDDNASEVVVIGRNGNQTQLTVQQLQDIYNEITGKLEQSVRPGYVPFSLTMEDLCQLNLKVEQLYEQYQIVAKNCDVTVTHQGHQRLEFSSFERFMLYDKSITSPVEEIVLNYNFLVILPRIQRPQSYSLKVRLISQLTMHRKVEQERPFPGMSFVVARNYRISIEFVDYLVGKYFIDAVEEWVKGLNHLRQPTISMGLKKRSQYLSLSDTDIPRR